MAQPEAGSGAGRRSKSTFLKRTPRAVLFVAVVAFLATVAGTSAAARGFGTNEGGLIAFVSDRAENLQPEIYAISLDGAKRDLSRNEASDADAVPSPDGTKIVFVSGRSQAQGVYVMNADGSGVRWLASGVQPSWSPDGSHLVFAGSFPGLDRGIYTIGINGTGLRTLHENQSSVPDAAPAWSPDGSTIAFDCAPGLCAVPAEGGETHVILNAGGCNPAWSPNGEQILFGCGAMGLISRDGTGFRRLTDSVVQEFDWAPDGRRIVFGTGTFSAPVIELINVDGSGRTTFARGYSPTWSPDGTEIAYARDQIYVASVSDREERALTRDPPSTYLHAYGRRQLRSLPDGRTLIFASALVKNDGDIYTMRPDGSGVEALTRNRADDVDPSWSPDGRELAFASDRSGNFGIYIMDAHGKHVRRLTHQRADDRRPNWSPDGSRIAFQRRNAIFVINVAGGLVRRLTPRGVVARAPSWSPDGRTIAFTCSARDRDGDPYTRICLLDARGRVRVFASAGLDDTIEACGSSGCSPVTVRRDAYLPSFSRDGRRIAFVTSASIEDVEGPFILNARLVVSNADGRSRTVTAFEGVGRATWSPDGTRLAQAEGDRLLGRGEDVYLGRAGRSRPTNVTGDSSGAQPDWQPR